MSTHGHGAPGTGRGRPRSGAWGSQGGGPTWLHLDGGLWRREGEVSDRDLDIEVRRRSLAPALTRGDRAQFPASLALPLHLEGTGRWPCGATLTPVAPKRQGGRCSAGASHGIALGGVVPGAPALAARGRAGMDPPHRGTQPAPASLPPDIQRA